MPERSPRAPERSFGPTVLAGLGGAALAAVAASREWATSTGQSAGAPVTGTVDGSSAAPLALALALVALAAWGVVLVLRGRVRTVAAGVGLLAACGVIVSVAAAWQAVHSAALEAVRASGATDEPLSTALTAWYWATAAGAAVCALALGVAVVRARQWPAMGSRYDAPSARAAAPGALGDERELWRALDEGHDPTS